MRHLKSGNRLGVTTAHRLAMMRNMVTSIIEHGQITCTLARAKEVRKPLEKMIGLGKRGTLHSRRQALRFVKSKEAMTQLFGDLAERYQDRHGGYCRIIKLGKNRLGDNSEMAIVQLLGSEGDKLSELKTQKRAKIIKKKKDSTVLKDVSEEIKQVPKSEKDIGKELKKNNVSIDSKKDGIMGEDNEFESQEEELIKEEKSSETKATDTSDIKNKVKAEENVSGTNEDIVIEKSQTEVSNSKIEAETVKSKDEKPETKKDDALENNNVKAAKEDLDPKKEAENEASQTKTTELNNEAETVKSKNDKPAAKLNEHKTDADSKQESNNQSEEDNKTKN